MTNSAEVKSPNGFGLNAAGEVLKHPHKSGLHVVAETSPAVHWPLQFGIDEVESEQVHKLFLSSLAAYGLQFES